MDDTTYGLILDSAGKLLSGRGGEGFDPALWTAVAEAGFPLALLGAGQGGFGFSAREAFAPVRVAAAHAVALPLGETLLANWVLSRAGLEPLAGPGALVWAGTGQVPFGRHLDAVVRLAERDGTAALTVLRPGAGDWYPGTSHAGEACDVLTAAGPGGAGIAIPVSPAVLRAAMTTLRTVQIAGAIEAVAAMCLRYCNEREQFGRPLGRFQAIQHQLAVLATHGCAAAVAADMAMAAFDAAPAQPDVFVLTAAAAKLRAAEAATVAASIAHQVHGAIGFSQEYPLHELTRRLWSWRDEDGREDDWAELLGQAVLAGRAGGLWPQITHLQSDRF
jgi:hypothetical protein